MLEIVKLNELNQIFKGIPSDVSNIWNSQNGRLIMHQYGANQFPSFIEVMYNTDAEDMFTKAGKPSSKKNKYDEFIKEITSYNFSLNSVKFFEYKRDNSIEDSYINEEGIFLNNECITEKEFKEQEILFDSNNVIASYEFSEENIKSMLAYDKEPYNIIFDFNDSNIEIVENIKDANTDSFLSVRLNKKFMPKLIENSTLSVDIYSTNTDYIYDVLFRCQNYKLNKAGTKVFNPMIIKYGIRILEL